MRVLQQEEVSIRERLYNYTTETWHYYCLVLGFLIIVSFRKFRFHDDTVFYALTENKKWRAYWVARKV